MRICDLAISLVGLVVLSPLIFFVFIVCYFLVGQGLFVQLRIGQNCETFRLFKFCTLRGGEPYLPTHELDESKFTQTAKFLRKAKLDELPQLLNVVRGEMSLVGPRPSLSTQHDVIDARRKRGVLSAKPGITGLAQVNGIDMSEPERLAEWDRRMLETLNLKNYFKYILLTILGKGTGDRISSK